MKHGRSDGNRSIDNERVRRSVFRITKYLHVLASNPNGGKTWSRYINMPLIILEKRNTPFG
ncbi:MAG TPA: hypothetical protein ENI51_09895 [Candidatus Atribacteria bacterium]|nr:hypothetical protein [Candidatus Atribacteria bacterium]